MRTVADVLSDLQHWGDAYREAIDTQDTFIRVVQKCRDVGEKAVEDFQGWVNGSISIPSQLERQEHESLLNELARNVINMRDSLTELHEYLNEWELMLSHIPYKHRRLLELIYRDKKSFEEICAEVGISHLQAIKTQKQAINLLRAIG